MNKKVAVAAASLVLAALVVGCGEKKPSTSEPDSVAGSISNSGSVSQPDSISTSTSTSNSTSTGGELTIKQQFDAITNFQGGLNQTQFFSKTLQIAKTSKNAKTRVREVHYEEGPVGPTFGMENDTGYTKYDSVGTCKLYGANDIIDCGIASETLTSKSDIPTIGNDVQQTFVQDGFVYSIVDDGSGTYKVPANYRYFYETASGKTSADYVNFTLNANTFSSLEYLLIQHFASAAYDATTEKYFTVVKDGITTITYWMYEEYTAPYVGQSQTVKVSASFDETNNLVGAFYENEYWFYGATVYSQTVGYSFAYVEHGAFEGVQLNPTNYMDLGTLIPEVEPGEHHEEAEDLLALITGAKNGEIAYAQATSSYVESFELNEMSSTRTYKEQTVLTTLYSDNVIVQDVSGSTQDDDYAYGVQVTADADNIYAIITDDPVKGNYKTVTPLGGASAEEVFNISESGIIDAANEFITLAGEGDELTYAITAGIATIDNYTPAEGSELVYIMMQAAEQQFEDGQYMYVGHMYTIEICAEIARDENGDATEVKIIYSYFLDDMQYDWETYAVEEIYNEYGYEVVGAAADDASYVVLDPKDFTELA